MGSIYSVQQINNYIRNMIGQDFLLGSVQVQGEASNCKYHHSGHIYFTLKDDRAAISCVMFAGNRAGLAFSMHDGDKVVVSGSVDVYEKAGTYQLYAKKITLAGAGELYEKFLALKAQLEEMGMFAPEYKKPIPKHVKRLGVVTAPTGAAIRDIQNIIRRRNPGIQIILYPALVQGEGAKESVAAGIEALDKAGVDVIIVGRGGGSIEDLWAFNEELVARAIFECETPVISAVGHETDTTIADFAADLRAPTPSAAAELASENVFDSIEKLSGYEKRMAAGLKRSVALARIKNEQYLRRLSALQPKNQLFRNREQLLRYRQQMRAALSAGVREQKHRLPVLQGRMQKSFEMEFQERKHRFMRLCERLDSLSPLKRLAGGFSYVQTQEGKALTSVKQAKKDDKLEIYVRNGIVRAQVTDAEVRTVGRKLR